MPIGLAVNTLWFDVETNNRTTKETLQARIERLWFDVETNNRTTQCG